MELTTRLKACAKAAAIGTALIFTSAASANIILTWDGSSNSSNGTATGASATAEFVFSDVGSEVLIGMTIRNTTGELPSFGSGATTSKLTGIAFDLVTPNDLANATFTAGQYLDTLIKAADAQPFGTIDVGIADNGNFNGGNANGALPEMTTDNVSLQLDFKGASASDVETAFFAGLSNGSLSSVARFQQVNAGAGSDKLSSGGVSTSSSTSTSSNGVPPTGMPAPGVLALIGAGLLGSVVARRRGRNAK